MTATSQIIALQTAAGKYVRVDPSKPTAGIFGSYGVYVDGIGPSDMNCRFTQSQPDGLFALQPVMLPNLFLGADATQFSGDLTKQLYVIGQRGGYESWKGRRLDAGAPPVLVIVFTNDGNYFVSVPLTVVVVQ